MANGTVGKARRRAGPIVGITGNIGAGKSTVAQMLAECGVHAIDADRVVHGLYDDPDGLLARAIAEEFGAAMLAADGAVDRAALGQAVFANAQALAKLERLVHPVVVAEIERVVQAVAPATPIAIEAIKLIESDLVSLPDAIWLVVAEPAAQLRRLRERGMSDEAAKRRLAVQAPPQAKIAHLRRQRGPSVPVVTIENTGSIAALRAQVRKAWQDTQAMLRKDMR